MSPRMVRLSGLAAMLGSLLGIALTPILTYLWATYSDLYGYFGRPYFLVFSGCLLGMAGLASVRSRSPRWRAGDNAEREVIAMTLIGLAIALVGCVLDYWGGSGEGFTRAQQTGYGLEMVGLLVVVLGSLLLGINYRRSRVVPAFVAWLLIAAGPGGVLLSLLLHLPSGSMLLFCCAWVILGYLLWTGRGVKTTT